MRITNCLVFSGIFLLALGCGDSISPDTTAPRVVSVSPLSGDTSASIASMVNATLSEAVDPQTVNESSFFLVRENGSAVSGTVNVSGSTLSLRPQDSLEFRTVYTAKITTAVKDFSGNTLASPYVWSFRTASDPDRWSVESGRQIPHLSVDGVGRAHVLGSYYANDVNKLDLFLTQFDENGKRGPVSDFVTPLCDMPRGITLAGNHVYVLRGQDQICFSDDSTFIDQYDPAHSLLRSVRIDENGSAVAAYNNRVYILTSKHPHIGVIIELDEGLRIVRRIELANRYVEGISIHDNNIYVTGRVLRPPYDEDIYVRKYDLNFNELWTGEDGDSTTQNGGFIAVSGSRVYVGTETGFHTPSMTGTVKPVVLVYDTAGVFLGSRILDENGGRMNGIAADLSGAYALVYSNSMLRPWKINPQGNVIWIGSSMTSNDITAGDIDVFGERLFIAYSSNKLALYNAQSGQKLF